MNTRLAIGILVLCTVTACELSPCPEGARRVGSQCRRPPRTVLDDAAVPSGNSCGDGVLDPGEECDLGDAHTLPGCDESCRVSAGYSCDDQRCLPIPEPPVLAGRASSDPDHVVWTWTLAEGSAEVRIELDGEPVDPGPGANRLELALDPGKHTCSIRACNELGACSKPSAHTTTAERYGENYASAFRGVRRALTSTALGYPTAVACRDCFKGADGEVLPLAETQSALATALTRGSDVLDLDVVLIDDELYVSAEDHPLPEDRPMLRTLLEATGLVASDAPLVLQVREADASAERFASRLLKVLDALPNIVKNGRPVFLMVAQDDLDVASQVQEVAERTYPLLAPYLRYWLVSSSADSVDDWLGVVDTVLSQHMQGVVVDYRAAHLFTLVSLLRAQGLGVWADNVPGPGDGEVVLAGLRDVVDGFFTDYRVDQARAIVKAPTTLASVDSRPHESADQLLPIRGIDPLTGELLQWERQLGLAPLLNSFGTPNLARWDSPGDPFLGGVLDFAEGERGLCISKAPLGARPEGVLVSVAATLGSDFATITSTNTSTLVSNDDREGFQLLLARDLNDALQLEFRVNVAGTASVARRYPASGGDMDDCTSQNGVFTEALQENRAYWLVGAYDGQGALKLFVDGRCAGTVFGTAPVGPIIDNNHDVCLGMQPSDRVGLRALRFYRGAMQLAGLLSWTPLAGGGQN